MSFHFIYFYRKFLDQLSLIDSQPVKAPWSEFASSTEKKVSCYSWQQEEFFHVDLSFGLTYL